MIKSESSLSPGEERTAAAEERTDFAEDRTLLATERTFASWMRTGYAAIGVALGFHALFNQLRPDWLPRLIATIFFVSAIVIFISAERRHCAVLGRLSEHRVRTAGSWNLRLLSWFSALAALALSVIIWRVRLGEVL